MDNSVQNIRSGRALKGFGKVLSGLGLVIAAIGAGFGGAVPVIVAGVVILLIGGLMGSTGGKKLQDAAQGGLAQAAMEQVLEEAEYRPGSCIDGGKFAESGLGLPQCRQRRRQRPGLRQVPRPSPGDQQSGAFQHPGVPESRD